MRSIASGWSHRNGAEPVIATQLTSSLIRDSELCERVARDDPAQVRFRAVRNTDRGDVQVFENVLERVREVHGIVNASIVGVPSGQILESIPETDSDIAVVAGAATDVVRAVSVMAVLLGRDEQVEDVVLTLTGTYHLLRPLPLPDDETALLLVTLDRERTNLALARRQLRDVEAGLVA